MNRTYSFILQAESIQEKRYCMYFVGGDALYSMLEE